MPGDLTSYLASRYLAADTKPTKKRKRKHHDAASSGAGLLITDDDDSSWAKPHGGGDGEDGDGVVGGATVAGTSAEFRKAKKSNWKTIGAGGGSDAQKHKAGAGGDDDAAAADAIISAAAAENEAARAAEDEAPVVDGADAAALKMSDGTHAGLQSAAAVTAQLEARQREEREQYERERRERRARGLPDEADAEAVYRDATGRRVDLALRREEARRAVLEAEDKERRNREALRGDVQVAEQRRRREALEDAALMPLARSADDAEMNRELRAQPRWNDPMAQFVTTTSKDDGGGSGAGKGKKKKGGAGNRPVYAGPAPPNRYGIRPGYRWDGVDRSNGFEAERFKAINRRERNKGLEYEWQMDE